jgi:hypothetical protein
MWQALTEPLTDLERRTPDLLTKRLQRDHVVPSYGEICPSGQSWLPGPH